MNLPPCANGALAAREQTAATSIPCLRSRVLANPRNIELRQKYLAVRGPQWQQADLARAARCVAALRLIRIVLGFTILGTVGIAVGDWWLGADTNGVALPILMGLGGAVSAAVLFAVLAFKGDVVFPEMVGEVSEVRPIAADRTLLGWVWDRTVETLCGAMWGAICGLLLGPALWAADAVLGLPHADVRERLFAGAVGGTLLGLVFAFLLILLSRHQAALARAWPWDELGPLPLHAYLGSPARARRRYLRFR